MTRLQLEAARGRVSRVLVEEFLDSPRWNAMGARQRDEVCSRLVSAVLGHPDGGAPRQPSGAGRRARRFAR